MMKKADEKSGEKVVEKIKKGRNLKKKKKTTSWETILVMCDSRKRSVCGPNSSTTPAITTPVISWHQNSSIIKPNPFLNLPSFSSSNFQFSSRKLGAAIWEFVYYFYPVNMYMGVNQHRVSRRNHHRLNKDEGLDLDHHYQHTLAVDPHRSHTPDHHPTSAGSLRRHIAASFMRHHQSAGKNKHALQPLSPASYVSSFEMAPYNPAAATPGSSIELQGKLGESSHGFKSSAELLKVLNRIWSLEEQHASNVSLVKSLKNELDHARSRIRALLRDQQANCHEIDELMRQISGDNISRKAKEQQRLDNAIQSVREELRDERKLRKRSESLHRKLAKELFEVKVSLSSAVKDLEKERSSNELLEELCDEFAKGLRGYERQVHALLQKSDNEWTESNDHGSLILHISESWLDERMQVKERQTRDGTNDQKCSVDKLRREIEAFLVARKKGHVKADIVSHIDHKENRSRRRSLESIPEAVSAPQCMDPEDSIFSDTRRVEFPKVVPNNNKEHKELASNENKTGQSPQNMHTSDLQNTPQEIDNMMIMKTGEATTPTEISMLQKSDVYDSIKESSYQRKKAYNDEGHGSNAKTSDKLISELLLSEGGSFPNPDYEQKKVGSSKSALGRNVSPVRQWMMGMKSPDPRIIGESSTKHHPVRDNTLKAKLQEPKMKGQRSRSKILKGLS